MVLCRELVGKRTSDYLGPPTQRPEWNKKPVDNSQIPELLARIAEFRQKNLTGEAVVFDWIKRRIQPLQARETFGFQYQGTIDSSRYSEEEISNEEVFSRIQQLLKNVQGVPVVPDTFSATNPPKQEDVELFKSSPPLPGTNRSFIANLIQEGSCHMEYLHRWY